MATGENLIGYGRAQVFDTSGIAKQYAGHVEQEKKEKAAAEEKFLKSIQVSTDGMRNADIEGFTGKYNDFVDWAAQNQDALRNPAKNPAVWTEFEKKKNELLQDVSLSKQAMSSYNDGLDRIHSNSEWYTTENQTALSTLAETPIYDSGFQDALGFQLGRDWVSALAGVDAEKMYKEGISEVGKTTTKEYSPDEGRIQSATESYIKTYGPEVSNAFGGDMDAAREYVSSDIRTRVKKYHSVTLDEDKEGFTWGGLGSRKYGGVGYSHPSNIDLDKYKSVVSNAGETEVVMGSSEDIKGSHQIAAYIANNPEDYKEISFSTPKKDSPTISISLQGEKGNVRRVVPTNIIKGKGGDDYLGYIVKLDTLSDKDKEALIDAESEVIYSMDLGKTEEEKAIAAKTKEILEGGDGDYFALEKMTTGIIQVIDAKYDGFATAVTEDESFWGFSGKQAESKTNTDPLGLGIK